MVAGKNRFRPLVSVIIIDYKKKNPYLTECLDAIQKQSYKKFEILLLTDYENDLSYPKLRKKWYGHYVGPAEKRDDGAKMAKGEILAFIDDDAYPSKHWLKHIVDNFTEKEIAGVAGPGVTPPHVEWKEEASGWVSASFLGSGLFVYRFLPGKKQFVDDYPSMNLAVRRKDFFRVEGYDSNFWPGEDTKFCLDLVYKLKKKIVYVPDVLVYHHRRPLWIPHLRQNGNFGLHRGYFSKALPKTSLRLIYFGPSLMVLALFVLFLPIYIDSWLFVLFTRVVWFMFGFYLFSLLINGLWVWYKSGKIIQGFLNIPAVFLTHFWYGIRFLQGFLLVRKLER